MKTHKILFNKYIWNKYYSKIMTNKPVIIYFLFSLIVLFGTSEVFSQTVNQISNSENHYRIGDNCSDFTCGDNNEKLLICHVPPGDPDNEHEICISSNAVQTHLMHGDYCGPCTLLQTQIPENLQNISIFPNPFTKSIFVELNQELLSNNENLQIIFYDLLGRTIKRATPIKTTKLEIDLSDLNNGIFIYNISNDKDIIGKGKIIKN